MKTKWLDLLDYLNKNNNLKHRVVLVLLVIGMVGMCAGVILLAVFRHIPYNYVWAIIIGLIGFFSARIGVYIQENENIRDEGEIDGFDF